MADFDRGFEVSEAEMQQFVDMGKRDSVKFDAKQYETSKRLMRSMIKGLIARDVYTDASAYTVIINHDNRELQAALSVLNDRARFDELLKRGNAEYDVIAARHKAAAEAKAKAAKTSK